MLTASVLNPDAELNTYSVIQSLQFIPGEQTTLAIQLEQPQKSNLRYMTPNTALLNVYIPNKDGSTSTVPMTVLAGDASIWTGTLTSVMTAACSGGNFTFTLDPTGTGTPLIQGYVQGGLSLVITGICMGALY